MKRFRFRLATLLRLRESDRDQRRSHLAEAVRALDLLIEQRGEIDLQLAEILADQQRAAAPGIIDIDRLTAVHRHQLLLLAHRAQLEDQAKQVSAEVERRREALVAADRDVRVLEKLRDSQHARHRQEEEAWLNKQLDEIAGRGWFHPAAREGAIACGD